jgi:predicted PurR-regulated permease PerM
MKSAIAKKATAPEITAWISMGVAMLLILKLHLLPALLAGLFVFELVHILAPKLRFTSLIGYRARLAVVFVLAILIVIIIISAVWSAVIFLRHESGSMPALLNKMAEIITDYKSNLQPWVAAYLPDDTADLRKWIVTWLRDHAKELEVFGRETGLAAAHILIGIVLGILLSLRAVSPDHEYRPLAQAWVNRVALFGDSFRAIVFAQARIAAINTFFTALFLTVALPLAGIHLPLVKTMIAVTFVAGMIPVAGNVISNIIITVVSLSHSFAAAVAAIVFLVVIHKLEYFLNAHIIGGRIRAHAWELLIAMFVMEAAFGLEGVIAAPIYYAYIKNELAERGLI